MKFFDPACSIDNSMRPIPFWSWNDKLSPDELRRQIRAMHSAGFGGFFMHARGGLQTEYMSQDWLDCVIACVDEAIKLNIEAWLYDENGWPSGYADGKVNGLGEDYQQKFIVVHEDNYDGDKAKIIAIYRKSDGKRLDLTTTEKDVFTLTYQVNPCYVDIFNPEATTAFIENTHQYYYDKLPDEIRKSIKGIFTDEPQIVIGKLFYSTYYAQEFKKQYGTDLLDDLIKIWYDFEGYENFRLKFYKLAGELFARNYTQKIHDWCKKHNWLLTGHMVQEINYAEQCFSSGAVSYHYPYFDIAGIDHLGRVAPSVFTVRQMTSIAAQFGINRRMVEIFACLGWDLNADDIRYYYHILQIYGVNFLCHHLFAYSLRGLRKRDYPPSFGTHEPYFNYLKTLNDEIARTNQIIASGREKVSCLLLHAQNSVWASYQGDNEDEKITGLIKSTENTTELLANLQVPFHFGFEAHIIDFGKIIDGKLNIGECTYDTIVIPEIDRLEEKTYALFRNFTGKIYRTGKTFKNIGSRQALPEEVKWFEELPILTNQLKGIIQIEGNISQIRSNCFQFANGNCYLIINHDRQKSFCGKITLAENNCSLLEINPVTGKMKNFTNSSEITLAPAQGLWLFADQGNSYEVKEKSPQNTNFNEIKINNFKFAEIPDNYLLLDNVRYRINNEEWRNNDISVIQWELLKYGNNTKCDIEFMFEVADNFELTTELNIIVETPKIFDFELNGEKFEWETQNYAFDKALEICRLPANLIRKGKNILTLHTTFYQSEKVYQQLDKCKYFETAVNALSFDMEIEPIYLMGKFAIQGEFSENENIIVYKPEMKIINFHSNPEVAEFTQNHLPFWAGETKIQAEFEISNNAEEYNLFSCELNNVNAVELTINNHFIGSDDHDFSEIEIPPSILKNGTNSLTIKLVSNLRNFMGPFHVPQNILIDNGISPGTFGKVANVFTGGRTPYYIENYHFKKTEIKNITIKKG